MNSAPVIRTRPATAAILVSLACAVSLRFVAAQGVPPPPEGKAPPLPPAPAALGVPKPAAATDGPYAPQPILPGGIVVPLYSPDSPRLRRDKIWEAERYN